MFKAFRRRAPENTCDVCGVTHTTHEREVYDAGTDTIVDELSQCQFCGKWFCDNHTSHFQHCPSMPWYGVLDQSVAEDLRSLGDFEGLTFVYDAGLEMFLSFRIDGIYVSYKPDRIDLWGEHDECVELADRLRHLGVEMFRMYETRSSYVPQPRGRESALNYLDIPDHAFSAERL